MLRARKEVSLPGFFLMGSTWPQIRRKLFTLLMSLRLLQGNLMNLERGGINERISAVHGHTSTLRFFMQHRVELVDYAASIIGCQSRAEDVVQEAYLRFDEIVEKDLRSHSAGYLFRIVRNLAIDWKRRQTVEDRYIGNAFPSEAATMDVVTPEAQLLYRNELQIVRNALAELPERTRVALEMYRLNDYKLKEIAQRLDISTALAHALIHEGLAHCRQRLHNDSI